MFSYKHEFIDILRNIQTFKENQTLKLLADSMPSGISGLFRVYIAYILLNAPVNMSICIASGLIVYSVYLLDRTMGAEEDKINRTSIQSSNKLIGYAVSLISFIIGCYVFKLYNILWIAFIPPLIGYLYNKELKFIGHNFKLKGGLGRKNIVVGVTWGLFITGVATGGILNLALFLYFSMKSFLNSAICDFKDVKGDTLTGLDTLPVILGAIKTRNLLLGLHFLTHIVLLSAMFHGIILFSHVIFLGSFLLGAFCIWNYPIAQLPIPRLFRDGESFIITLLLLVVNIVHM
jgi:4-hydroxybenzoate polyprenyltransferase